MTPARAVVVGTGLLGALVALGGVGATSRHVPVWLESRTPCEEAGECAAADIAAGLERGWWVVGAGLAVLAAAAVLLAWTLPAQRREAPARPPLPAPVHALTAGLVAFGSAFVVGFPVVIAAFGGGHLLAVVLTGAWLAQAYAVGAAGRLVRSGPLVPGQEWLAALAVSGLGVGAVVVTYATAQDGAFSALPVVDAVVVAVAVLGQRSLSRLGRPPVWTSVAGGVAVLVAGTALLAALLTPEAAEPDPLAGPPPQVEPLPVPSPTPTDVPPPTPEPVPPPGPVEADVPCGQQDLAFSIGGFDGAMGLRAAALVATNTGAGPCWLEGVPVVVLVQGGQPLALQVGEGQTPEGGVPQVERVGVAPGGTASALLTWRTYGGWADPDTPQAVTVALDATTTLVSATLPADAGAAPFDLADGGAWGIAPWATPTT